MSDYFSDVRQGLGDAVERRAHLRWYSRLSLRVPTSRPLAVLLAALVIATPAVGAVTNWFSFGKPDATPPLASNGTFGVVRPGGSRLLPLVVSDPQGGPPWGLRLVRTDRGNTCLQLGRLEAGQLGSLGIDYAWNNDHEFHPLSANATYADSCGSTDAVGHGYENWGVYGESASANPTDSTTRGPESRGCKPRGVTGEPSWPYCPVGSNRLIFYGLLGPDAKSITYRKPDGARATERTVGGVGAYLLVFAYDRASCDAYGKSPLESNHCGPSAVSSGIGPGQLSPVTGISYRDGHSCRVDPPAPLLSAYEAFNKRIKALPELPTRKRRYAQYDRLWRSFLRREHVTATRVAAEMHPSCPAVGWVTFKRTVTKTEVAAPIHLRTFPAGTYSCPKNTLHLPDGCNHGVTRKGVVYPTGVVPVEWSFEAREPVSRSNSWYSWSLRYPRGCGAGGEGGGTDTRIGAGQTLRYSTFVNPKCHGTYRLVVGYMQDAPPGVVRAGGGASILTGRDGSLVVGRASFIIR